MRSGGGRGVAGAYRWVGVWHPQAERPAPARRPSQPQRARPGPGHAADPRPHAPPRHELTPGGLRQRRPTAEPYGDVLAVRLTASGAHLRPARLRPDTFALLRTQR